MNYRINIGVRLENLIKLLFIKKIALYKFRTLARNRLNSVKNAYLAVAKVVNNNYILSCVDKLNNGMRTNVSGTTGN